MSKEVSTEDELHELSPGDAEELRAFLEKRRWFEAKLKVLETLPAIYPFLHPVLLPVNPSAPANDSSLPYRHEHDKESQYHLPSAEQIQRWQSERVAFEEDILAFDGGDLGRMKEKTKAATLLPLTPPSTRLVSITLALVILIDRLLTILRHRGELLELTSLRLQWDNGRWQVVEDLRQLVKQVDELVRSKGRWRSGVLGAAGPNSPRSLSAQKRSPQESAEDNVPDRIALDTLQNGIKTPRSTSPTQSRGSPYERDGSTRPSRLETPVPRTPGGASTSQTSSPNRETTKRGLHLPLLHSSIINLQIRHHNLSSTGLARTGALLDKMIDCAGPLKDLGGPSGPTRYAGEQNESGAVPDALLEVQEGLEAEVEQAGEEIALCRQLEQQWELAETHHAGSALAYEEAVKLSSELMKSLDRPATCEQHRHLLMLLETARNHLPGAVDDDFSRPSHPAYPEQDNHNDRIVATLEAAYQKAIMKLDACQEGLNWYDKLWKAARKVLERRTDIDDLSRTLHGRMEVALTGRPILDEPISLSNDHTSWLMMLPSHLEKIEGSIQKSFESVQFSTVAIMQYRQVLRAGPDPWKSDHNMGGQSCELADEVESLSDELLEAAQRALIPSRFAKQDGEILPIVQGVMRSADNISRSCMAIQQELSAAVDNSAWRVASEVQGDPSVLEDLRNLQTRIREQMVLPMSALDEVLRRYQRDLPILREHLSLELAEAMTQQTSLIGLADLLQRVRDQAAFVRTIEVEAIRLQSKIEVTQAQISHTRQVRDQRKDEAEVQHHKTPESLIQQVEKFASEAAMWESELAGRVPFVAAGSSASSFHHQHSPYDPDEAQTAAIQIAAPLLPASVSIAEPPLTPPSSPSMSSEALDTAMQEPPDSSSLLDLTNLDQKVRAHVNDLASRVAAAISHCQSSASTLKGTPVVPMISHDDVFGPLVASHLPGPNRHSASDATSRTDGPANRIRELHQQLDALQIDSVVQLSVPALYSSPLLRRLPTQQEAQLIQTEFLSLSARFTELVTTDNHPAYGEHYALQSALTNVKILLPQLVLLGSFSDTVKACDTVLSSLLEAIDAGESADVRRAIDAASTAMDRVEVTAEPVEADCRVTAEVKRILAAWDGLQGMMEGKVRPDHSHLSQETDEVASGSSSPAVSAFKFLPQPPSVHPGRAGSRSTSNPTATASKYLTATVSSRNRSASDTPTRSRRIVSRLVEVPGSSIEAVGNGVNLPMTSPAKQIPSSIALSAGMVARATATTPRTRKSSRHMPILKYFAIPKSTLDVAVGGIINKLHEDVAVIPVGLSAGDDWKDQSGRYWIGAEGRAKLCFCRILRSRTVMVRVGGGWVELSRFLLDHFADAFGSRQRADSIFPTLNVGSASPIPLTSASLVTASDPARDGTCASRLAPTSDADPGPSLHFQQRRRSVKSFP